MTNQPTVYVLVGLPGSGKSTWTKNIHPDLPVASTDDYIDKKAAELGLTYSEVFADAVKPATAAMNADVDRFIRTDQSFIWDQTNLGAKKRKSILARIPKHWKKVAVVFNVSPAELKARLSKRASETGKIIDDSLIDMMRGTYAPPSRDEGFDEIIKGN